MPVLSGGLVDRRILSILNDRIAEEPVIALHGPRSVGKSTLLRAFAEAHGVVVVDLDDPVVLDAVSANPSVAVASVPPVCIDEYQRALDVLDAIKARLNREGSAAGTAVLTGSTRHDAIPRTAQALTGRLHVLTILPLSQGEIAGVSENLIEALAIDPSAAVAAHPTSSTTRQSYAERVCAGGFPLALQRSDRSRARWFSDYVRLGVERDAAELAQVRHREVLRRLVDVLAGQTGQVLNVAEAARRLDTKRETVAGYTRLLEDLFLFVQLPAWGKTLRARAARLPKVHVVDSGLGAWLLGARPDRLAALDPSVLSEFGHLLESFVVGEIRKQVSWLDDRATLGHWRVDDDEVDVVVEFDDGRVLAFEVKSNQR
ncbi:MAG: ATP-binding protein, partial [Acidimicrobiales bacterium]